MEPVVATASDGLTTDGGEDAAALGVPRWRRGRSALLLLAAVGATAAFALAGLLATRAKSSRLDITTMSEFVGSVQLGTGCENWADISMSGESWYSVTTADQCAALCNLNEGCIGFGYRWCDADQGPAACYLWRGRCIKHQDPCWNHFELKTDLVPEEAREDWTINAWAASCLNWETMKLGATTVVDADECGRICKGTPGCGSSISPLTCRRCSRWWAA